MGRFVLVKLFKTDLFSRLIRSYGFIVTALHAAYCSPHVQRLLIFYQSTIIKSKRIETSIFLQINSIIQFYRTLISTYLLKKMNIFNEIHSQQAKQLILTNGSLPSIFKLSTWDMMIRSFIKWRINFNKKQLISCNINLLMLGFTQANYAITTLATCDKESCIRYLIRNHSNIVQICITSMLILWLIYEFVMQIKLHMRLHFSWQEVLFVQIFLCLSFNICFTLWSDVIIWYVMESFIYQIYFTTLVYYFSMKYFQKAIKLQQRKPYIVGLIITYVIFCLSQLGLFITLVNEGTGRCKQVGEIVIDAIMIVLGIVFFYLAYRNETEEKKKFEEFQVRREGKNPLTDIWIWVCLNIIGQIFNEVENSLIYSFYGQNQCTPVESTLESNILSSVFMFFTFVISFASTLWFYHKRRLNEQESYQMIFSQLELSSAQADIENRVQIVKLSSYNESSIRHSLMQPFI